MNYLNEEYKNLSDLDKKNILPGIIKFLQEEKQKVDDKINGAENGKVFLRRLEIEESDIALNNDENQSTLNPNMVSASSTSSPSSYDNVSTKESIVDKTSADNIDIPAFLRQQAD